MQKLLNIPEYFAGTFEPSVQVIRPENLESLEKTASEAWDYIKDVKPKPGRRFILVIAMGATEYWGCFLAGSKVLMADGTEKAIETIKAGDMVISHTGKPCKVLTPLTREWAGDLYTFSFNSYGHKLACTEEHPVYAVKGADLIESRKKYYKQKETYEEFVAKLSYAFVQAKDLGVKDYIAIPFEKREAIDPDLGDHDKAYALGYYLGNGCGGKEYRDVITRGEWKRAIFTVRKSDKTTLSTLERVAASSGHAFSPRDVPACGEVVRVEYGSKDFISLCKAHLGDGAKTKYLSSSVMQMPPSWQRRFLAGYLQADGHQVYSPGDRYHGALTSSTASKKLSQDLVKLGARLGYRCSSFSFKQHHTSLGAGKAIYENGYDPGLVDDLGESRFFQVEKKSRPYSSYLDHARGYILYPVKSVSVEEQEAQVFNLEVEKDNSYCVNSIAVHNCNKNGDAFPEKDLIHCYKNFETEFDKDGKINGGALIYKHHKNKIAKGDPWFGTVSKAFYNHRMHRVELLLEVWAEKGQDIIDKIDRGETVAVSMGCRIPYDACVHPNAEVVTPQGLQPICEIKLGDQVLTHKNRFRKVTRLFKNAAPKTMVRFRATGDFHEALVTANHPMYVLKREEIFFPSGGRRKPGFLGMNLEPAWIDAGKVAEKDYLLRTVPACGDVRVDPKFAYLVGHYLGDGHLTFDTKGKDPTKPMQVQYTTHLDDRETIVRRLADYMLDLGWDVSVRTNKTVRPDGKTVKAITTSTRNREFAKFCNDVCGTKKSKRVPDAVFSWDQESIKHFLGGYIDADGCFRKHNKDDPGSGGTLTSTSVIEGLSRGMQTLFHMVGMSASIREDPIGKTGNTFSDATVGYVLNVAKSHAEKLRGYSRKITTTTEFEGQGPDNFFFTHDSVNYWAMKIREKEEVSSPCQDVYNLTVEEDESYVADGFVTHNCSICHNKAKTREQYCEHLKQSLGKILPTGKKVYAINGGYDYKTHPKALNFFDISIVFRPADPTGYMLKKVAEDSWEEPVVGSAELYDKAAGHDEKVAFLRKMSTIDKIVKGFAVAQKDDHGDVRAIKANKPVLDRIVNRMKPIGPEKIEALSHYPMNKVLSTLSKAGIILTTPEFISLVVLKLTGKHLPPKMLHAIADAQGELFEKLSEDPEQMDEMEHYDMFRDVESDPEIEDIISDVRDSRDLTEQGMAKKAATDVLRSVLDMNDASLPWGDGKGMMHSEYVTDPQTGTRYAASMSAIEDAQLWENATNLVKILGGAALLGGTYYMLKARKNPLAPLAGAAGLALGAKGLVDTLRRDKSNGYLMAESGKMIPSSTMAIEKKGALLPAIAERAAKYKNSANRTLKSIDPTARVYATFAPVAATALLKKYYDDRIQVGTAGTYRDDVEKHLDSAGHMAYTHPILTGAAGVFAGHTALNMVGGLRRSILGK